MIGRRDHQASRRLPGHVSVTVYLVSFIERNRLFQSFFGERERAVCLSRVVVSRRRLDRSLIACVAAVSFQYLEFNIETVPQILLTLSLHAALRMT